jgi:ATP-binding cassette subfamily C protein
MPTSSRLTDAASTVHAVRVVESEDPALLDTTLELTSDGAWIGRADDCNLVIPEPGVSRRHVRLDLVEGGLLVRDNGSANGVLVGGKKVAEATLGAGQRFRVGSCTFELVITSAAAEVESGPSPEQLLDRTISISSKDIEALVAQLHKPKSFEEEGEVVVTAANRPFLLSDPTAAWVVESGKIEIFTVALDRGEPTGARTHFLTVDPGQAFFGMDELYAMGSAFMVVGKAGSQLRQYSTSRLQELANNPLHRARIRGFVDQWVEGLSRRLTSDFPNRPDGDAPLAPGQLTTVVVGKRAVSGRGVSWIVLPAARLLFDSMATLSHESEGVLFPLAPGSWLELVDGAEGGRFEAKPQSTDEGIADARLWAGLDVFHRLLCECEFLNKKLATVDEFNRLRSKAKQTEEAEEAGFGAIGSVLGGTGIWQRPAAVSTDPEPVFRACVLVGQALGMPVRKHPDSREERSFEENVTAISTASRCRTRRVTLGGTWYKNDQGPLLGQVEETKAPVALLPTSPTSYQLVEPITGERRKVTPEVAATLSPFGFTFYRPFPDGMLKVKDLVRFGMSGLLPEFRTVAMMGVAVGMLGVLSPMITGKVYDTAIPQAERGLLFQFSLALLFTALGTSAFKITQSVAMLRVQGKMDYSVQAAVWDRLLELPLTFFRKYSSGDLADRASGVDQIRSIIAGAGVAAILGSFSSVFNVFQMMGYSFKLGAVAIGLTTFYVSLTTAANFIQLRFQRDESKRRGRITGLVLQLITGVAKLRVSGAENHAFRVWATEFADQRRVSFRVGRVRNAMAVFNNGFPVISSMAIFATMVSLKAGALERGETFEMTTGDFLAFSAAYGVFLGAMQSLGDASLGMLKVVPIYERLQPILLTAPEVDATKAYPGKLEGGIEISHVSFRYSQDAPWILKDVSIKIRPGEFVAFVGGSGSGKSTLMRVMLGFEVPEKGSVYYDGQDLATLDVRLVRQQLGVVLQDSRLLPADIYRNIVGASSRTVEEAWEAAAKCGLAADIKAMPMGMHTYVSEGGGGFSGGQKQRLMIARALVHKPKVLFLDEATSALDNKTQATVTESMDKLSSTRVVIAHRLSTIINADTIYYLEQGELKESGSFKELMEKDGLFAALAKRQLA